MKNLVYVVVFALLISGSAFAQNRLSLNARMLYKKYSDTQQNDNSAMAKLRSDYALQGSVTEPTVHAIISYTNSLDKEKLRSLGVVPQLDFDTLMSCILPVSKLMEVAELGGIVEVTAGDKLVQFLDKALPDAHVLQVQNSMVNNTQFDGTGVIVGVIDRGFDFTHPMFQDALGNCRVKRAWLVSDSSGTPPEGYSYGTLYTDTRYIKDTLQHGVERGMHGTHVLGIAAGRNEYGIGSDSGYGGVAPNADIVVVELTQGYIADAIDYIFDYADSVNKPCVINISLGYYLYDIYNNGHSYYDELIRNVLRSHKSEGRIVCNSAGNEAGDHNHFTLNNCFGKFTGNVIKDNVYTTAFDFKGGMEDISILTAAECGDFEMSVTIVGSDGTEYTTDFYSPSSMDIYLDTLIYSEDGQHYLYFIFQNCVGTTAQSGLLYFSGIYGNVTSVSGMSYSIRPLTDNVHINSWGGSPLKVVDGGHTIDSYYSVSAPGDMAEIITVGAHCTKNIIKNYKGDIFDRSSILDVEDITYFSSWGPTSGEEHIKPDITGPGALIVSAANRYGDDVMKTYGNTVTDVDGNNTPTYLAMQGTSMSSPFVAGCVALALQTNPDLTMDELKEIFSKTAKNDDYTGDARNNKSYTWGYGKIDIGMLLYDITGMSDDPVSKIVQISPPNATKDLDPGAVTLVWSSASNFALYQLQVSTDATFKSADTKNYELCYDTSQTISIGGSKRYYWRVRAFNLNGDTTDWTKLWYFETKDIAPRVPVLISPANGSIISAKIVQVVWQKAANAASYGMQMSTDSTFKSAQIIKLSDTTTTIPLMEDSKHYWRIKSYNSNKTDSSDFSSTWMFSSDMSIEEPAVITEFKVMPNPVTYNANILFNLVNAAHTTIKICDILGNEVASISGYYDSGANSMNFDVSNLTNGSYICRMLVDERQVATTNFILNR
jgi:subtilisin family serine protease